jgi:hypothetical protein
MGLLEIGWEGVDLIHLGQNSNKWRGPCELADVPSCCRKYGEFHDYPRNY